MAERSDYYDVLGVPRDATLDQIKSAYRKAALKFHPDRNPGDKDAEARFKEAAQAYAILADPEKRSRYDRFGEAGLSGAGGGFDPDVFAGFEDLFGGIFGDLFGGDAFGGRAGRGRRAGPRRGQDLRFDLEIEFEEAVLGTETQIRVPHTVTCEACGGSGAATPEDVVTCVDCGGAGQQRYARGFFSIARTCGRCGGSGRSIRSRCGNCRGAGETSRERTLKVKIPAGVESYSRLRVPREGDAGPGGGPPGDLYVYIMVRDHPVFRRDGQDLVCTIPLTFSQAALGTTMKLQALEGTETIKVPPGTQSGTVVAIKGRGIRNPHGAGRGDLLVELIVRTPSRLSREGRKLLEKLGGTGDEVHPSEDRAILDRLS